MNVHPANSLDELLNNISHQATSVNREFQRICTSESMSLGLWFPASVASQLRTNSENLRELKQTLQAAGLTVHTVNGFPFGDFHQDVVKHDVYLPTWADSQRVSYTLDLIEILAELIPPGRTGTISTLPLGWPTAIGPNREESEFFERCCRNLCQVAARLTELNDETGKQIQLCLEPEPGCILSTTDDLVEFYLEKLRRYSDYDEQFDRFLGACHDVCHSAVMMEPQAAAIQKLITAKIPIGKIQISSAPWYRAGHDDAADVTIFARQLSGFDEPKYLHQTMIQGIGLIDDLPLARKEHQLGSHRDWRIHFHVPIYLERLGLLWTTQSEILECLRAIKESALTQLPHFEVETYAWNVLPSEQRWETLERGIAQELAWFLDQAGQAS